MSEIRVMKSIGGSTAAARGTKKGSAGRSAAADAGSGKRRGAPPRGAAPARGSAPRTARQAAHRASRSGTRCNWRENGRASPARDRWTLCRRAGRLPGTAPSPTATRRPGHARLRRAEERLEQQPQRCERRERAMQPADMRPRRSHGRIGDRRNRDRQGGNTPRGRPSDEFARLSRAATVEAAASR